MGKEKIENVPGVEREHIEGDGETEEKGIGD